jgi:hypothetical protein
MILDIFSNLKDLRRSDDLFLKTEKDHSTSTELTGVYFNLMMSTVSIASGSPLNEFVLIFIILEIFNNTLYPEFLSKNFWNI